MTPKRKRKPRTLVNGAAWCVDDGGDRYVQIEMPCAALPAKDTATLITWLQRALTWQRDARKGK